MQWWVAGICLKCLASILNRRLLVSKCMTVVLHTFYTMFCLPTVITKTHTNILEIKCKKSKVCINNLDINNIKKYD